MFEIAAFELLTNLVCANHTSPATQTYTHCLPCTEILEVT